MALCLSPCHHRITTFVVTTLLPLSPCVTTSTDTSFHSAGRDVRSRPRPAKRYRRVGLWSACDSTNGMSEAEDGGSVRDKVREPDVRRFPLLLDTRRCPICLTKCMDVSSTRESSLHSSCLSHKLSCSPSYTLPFLRPSAVLPLPPAFRRISLYVARKYREHSPLKLRPFHVPPFNPTWPLTKSFPGGMKLPHIVVTPRLS